MGGEAWSFFFGGGALKEVKPGAFGGVPKGGKAWESLRCETWSFMWPKGGETWSIREA